MHEIMYGLIFQNNHVKSEITILNNLKEEALRLLSCE